MLKVWHSDDQLLALRCEHRTIDSRAAFSLAMARYFQPSESRLILIDLTGVRSVDPAMLFGTFVAFHEEMGLEFTVALSLEMYEQWEELEIPSHCTVVCSFEDAMMRAFDIDLTPIEEYEF